MSDIINVRKSLASLKKQEAFDGYSKVVIVVSDDMEYIAGDDTGRTMTLECPWGTQQMANNILSKIRGFQYQPYTASNAHLDPAAEIGDGFSAGNIYSGVYKKDVSHGVLYTASVAAPGGEKINYEYEYKSPETRRIERQYAETRATFKVQSDRISAEVLAREIMGDELRATLQVQADAIEARVTKQGGNASSFGWVLDAESWTLKSGGSDVFKATKDGVEVKGIIRATGGEIGGFSIQRNYLSYNNQTWNGTNATGIYIGQSGIQCGSEANGVQITPTGKLYAESGYFRGSVNAGNIEYGGNAGYFDGSGLEDHSVYGTQIGYSTISTAYTSGGINTSLGYADFSNGVFNGWNRASQIACDQLSSYQILLDRREIYPTTISYKGSDGSSKSMNVVAWRWR